MDQDQLDERQTRLVEDHLHLVKAHLRRHLAPAQAPRRDREDLDLYQEGCLGLIQAVKRYDPDSGIPFGAFAARRIHQAVSRALYEGFTIMRVPMRTQRRQTRECDEGALRAPVVHSLEHDPPTRRSDARTDPANQTTVASRIREKYESAVRRAQDSASSNPGRRGDRSRLVACLVEGRLLVPDDERKTPLREIARETRSSYSRVANCEKKLAIEIGETLRRDPEYRRLEETARRSGDGFQATIDNTSSDAYLGGRLEDALGSLPQPQADNLLWRVVELTGGQPRVLLSRMFARLSTERKIMLCDELESLCIADKTPER